MPDRYAPPEHGLPMVESVCENGHRWAGEMAWLLPLVIPQDIPLTGSACPDCNATLRVLAGSYERDGDTGVYVRTGPPDPAVDVPIDTPTPLSNSPLVLYAFPGGAMPQSSLEAKEAIVRILRADS